MMCLAMLALVTISCSSNDEDGYIASTLRNHDWQGTISEYYQSRWGITGSEYSTVMSLESKDAYRLNGSKARANAKGLVIQDAKKVMK